MTSPIHALPTELIRMIVKNVPKQDLKRLRLASRKFHREASEILFRRVYASPHKKDLSVLSDIANHPVLRCCPCEIVYVGVFFDPLVSQKHWFGREHPEQRLSYRRGMEEQKEMIRSGLDVDIITSALTQLPSIRKVTFSNHWCPESSNPPSTRDYPSHWARPTGNLSADIDNLGKPYCDYGLMVMCRAISNSGRKVEEFSMHYHCSGDNILYDHTKPCHSGFDLRSIPVDTDGIVFACRAFRSMRKIELSLTYRPNDDLFRLWKDWCAVLAKILSVATELRELTLNFNHRQDLELEIDDKSNKLPLTAAITARPLPMLHTLKLRRKYMQPEELIALLKPLAGTLETLELASIYLMNGSWRATAMALHKLEWKRLERVNFIDLGEYRGLINLDDSIFEEDYVNCLGVDVCMLRGDPDLISETPLEVVPFGDVWCPLDPTDDYCESFAREED
ncbi:hypothetical protein ABKA04_007889 [Annulohypoxylon sp. FPYF3050]